VEHSNKISFFTIRKTYGDVVSRQSGKKPYFGFLEKNFVTSHISIMLKKHSPLNRAIDIKIDQLIQSGIMQRKIVEARFAETTKIAKKQKEEEKQEKDAEKLTIEHLELCFYVVLIGLTLSCVVFAVELLIGYLWH
jgi:hypothetical protein